VTIVWFVVWLVADHLGDRAPLHFAPANAWAATLILAVALDLSRHHATDAVRGRKARGAAGEE
jgi:hypothetical protein